MHLHTRNVNTAFRELVSIFHYGSIEKDTTGYPKDSEIINPTIVKKSSRNGNVLMIDEPVTITYSHPRERVLFNAARDANPFLHLYEALWMLAGRNDVAPLTYYTKKMADFSDDGKTLNGAYGYRWRRPGKVRLLNTEWSKPTGTADLLEGVTAKGKTTWGDQNQLDILVAHLNADPNSRRAVLQMWNVENDLLKIGGCDCGADRTGPSAEAHDHRCSSQRYSRDVCCNLSVMFSIREVEEDVVQLKDENNPSYRGTMATLKKYLDITVTNRSNDLIWGLLGANYVHFTFLQEYMAARLGVEVGKYHHFSNNLHVYDWNWEPDKWLADCVDYYNDDSLPEPVQTSKMALVKDPAIFEEDLPLFVERHKDGDAIRKAFIISEPFFRNVAEPALLAFHFHKKGLTKEGLQCAGQIKADDWRLACTNWLLRRVK